MFAWTQGLLARADFDNNPKLRDFAEMLEGIIIQTVQNGHYTRDIAQLIEGTEESKLPRSSYLNTFEFIDKVAIKLK